MKDEILPRMGILILYQLQGLGEPCLVGEVGTVRHPERITCHLAPDVDDGTSHGNLYLFDFVEYEQAQLLVKSVEHHHFPEGCLGLELVLQQKVVLKKVASVSLLLKKVWEKHQCLFSLEWTLC